MTTIGSGGHPEAGLVPFADRLLYTHAVRMALVAVVAVTWVTGSGAPSLDGKTVAMLCTLLLLVTTPTVLAGKVRRSLGITVFGFALLLDGVFLAAVSYAAAGFQSPLVLLVLVHVVSTTLLGSFRTGLKLALWHSLLIGSVLQLQQGGLIDVATGGTAGAAILGAGVWLVTIVTASAGAANERELRRRNYDLHALARLGLRMDETTDPDEIARAIVDAVSSEFDLRVVALAASAVGEPVLIAAVGTSPPAQQARPAADALVAETMRLGVTRRIAAPDPHSNPWLASVMPTARHVVLVPVHGEGRSLGVLVFEYSAGKSARIERRIVEMVEQFVAQGALALQNAWLLGRIAALATTDGLTGIANRRSFELVLARERNRADALGQPFSLLLVDIDFFKRHNDTYGHQQGDRTLRAVAQALARNGRQSDIAARYGGEEFAVVLPGADTTAAVDRAERLRALVATLPDPRVTVSVGVASYPVHGATDADLIKAADSALYRSKHNGRDQVTVAVVDVLAPVAEQRAAG